MSADTDTDYYDFDAAFAERSRKPKRMKLFGRHWHLPPALPAAAVLTVARWVREGRASLDSPQATLTDAELVLLAEDLIPGETLSAWHAKGLDIEQLGPIIEWVMVQYRDQIEEALGRGGAEAPPVTEGASTSSSADGDSSRPTSSASTPFAFPRI